jgi:transposase
MRAGIRISSLVPSGLVMESVSDSSDSIIIAVRAESGVAECPLCGARSSRIHSRYDRQAADLPCAGKEIRLRVITRRFVCEVPHCRRRIFAERFGDDVLPSRSRRTARLDCIVHHLGLVLGGRPAASFAKRLMLPVSNDTLLRVVRRRTALRTDPLTVVGIDDWAFRRNRRYARSRQFEPGSPIILGSRWCHAIAVAVMVRRLPRRCRTPFRSPIVGT